MPKKCLAVFFLLSVIFNFNAFARTESSKAIFKNKYAGNPYLNERFVKNALRQIQNAQMIYRESVGQGRFGIFFQLHQANLIDASLASHEKYGYSFMINVSGPTGGSSALYNVTATPRRYGKTGRKSFYIDENCEIRGADKNGAHANINDPIIETCTPSMRVENERLTIQSLRTIHSAQMTYQTTTGNGNFGTISQLQDLGLISQSLGFNFYRGYFRTFRVTASSAGNPSLFTIQTAPEIYGRTGVRSFFVDQTGVIRGADRNGANATQSDPPIEDEIIK